MMNVCEKYFIYVTITIHGQKYNSFHLIYMNSNEIYLVIKPNGYALFAEKTLAKHSSIRMFNSTGGEGRTKEIL